MCAGHKFIKWINWTLIKLALSKFDINDAMSPFPFPDPPFPACFKDSQADSIQWKMSCYRLFWGEGNKTRIQNYGIADAKKRDKTRKRDKRYNQNCISEWRSTIYL